LQVKVKSLSRLVKHLTKTKNIRIGREVYSENKNAVTKAKASFYQMFNLPFTTKTMREYTIKIDNETSLLDRIKGSINDDNSQREKIIRENNSNKENLLNVAKQLKVFMDKELDFLTNEIYVNEHGSHIGIGYKNPKLKCGYNNGDALFGYEISLKDYTYSHKYGVSIYGSEITLKYVTQHYVRTISFDSLGELLEQTKPLKHILKTCFGY